MFKKLTIVLMAGLLAKFCFWKHYVLWPLLFVMFFILLESLKIKDSRKSFWYGYWFGVGYFSGSLHWVHLSFEAVSLPIVVGYIANILLILYLAIYPALSCWFYILLKPTSYVFFACSWSLFEFIRGITFTGFPWNLVGYATCNIPYFKQIASIVGVYGVSLIFMIIIVLFLQKKTFKHGIAIILIVIAFGFCKEKFVSKANNELSNQAEITIIQPCISIQDKMNQYKFQKNLSAQLELSNSKTYYTGLKLIIWPENSTNIVYSINQLYSLLKNEKTYLLFGSDRIDNNNNVYNSMFVIGKQTNIIYDKKHLLPFGEFIPDFLLDFGFQKIASGITNFSKGKIDRLISIEGIPTFAPTICYESVFPGEIIENRKKTKLIINITNDAWFSESDEIYQHLRCIIFRAIEEGVPVVRCANTGISCIIDCNGNILKQIPENVVGSINSKIPQQTINTPFSKYGNIIFILLLLSIMCTLKLLRIEV